MMEVTLLSNFHPGRRGLFLLIPCGCLIAIAENCRISILLHEQGVDDSIFPSSARITMIFENIEEIQNYHKSTLSKSGKEVRELVRWG
ncbi:hypothetical protein GF357_04245 [Candidatus Dojkabacteria bacterium]|nr:hypothetical protein [Candidatus Dojkabacteria bacterium]